jgi:hypothetical protein
LAYSSGFFKGEKKKKKKGEGNKPISIAPVFTPPSVEPKGKSKY